MCPHRTVGWAVDSDLPNILVYEIASAINAIAQPLTLAGLAHWMSWHNLMRDDISVFRMTVIALKFGDQ